MLLRAGNVFNCEFDTAERLFWLREHPFHLTSINNGIHTKMGKFMTDTHLKPAHEYMYITNKIQKHICSCK